MSTLSNVKLLSSLIAIFFFTLSCAEEKRSIEIPNPQIIGKSLSQNITLILGDDSSHIQQLMFDISDGKISGIMATYKKEVKFNQLFNAINYYYLKWRIDSSQDMPVKLWRIESERKAIQLSVDTDNNVQVIVLPFNEKGEKGGAHES